LHAVQDRPDILFDSKPSSESLATCLRTCSPPFVSYVKPFSHTRHITHTTLLNALQPFLCAAAQRAALAAWLAAITNTATCGSDAATCQPSHEFGSSGTTGDARLYKSAQ
jgi:hypothetical protein